MPNNPGDRAAVTVRVLSGSELAWANQCYGKVHFQPSPPQDYLAVAEINDVKAGLGRLVRVDETTGELGGIYVPPAFRGRQVARAVVSFLLRQSPYRRLFCIPFAHLEAFYRSFGFEPVSASTSVPDSIGEKVSWCLKEYRDPVSLLVRVA